MKERSPFDPPKKKRHVGKIILYIFLGIIIAIIIACTAIVVVAKKNNTLPEIFGYGIAVEKTETMLPTIENNDGIIYKKTDPKEITNGNIIVIKYGYDDNGNPLYKTERVTDYTYNATTSKYTFTTVTDNQEMSEIKSVKEESVFGKLIYVLPKMGSVISFLETPFGIALCIAIPVLIILIIETIHLVKLNKEGKDEFYEDDDDEDETEKKLKEKQKRFKLQYDIDTDNDLDGIYREKTFLKKENTQTSMAYQQAEKPIKTGLSNEEINSVNIDSNVGVIAAATAATKNDIIKSSETRHIGYVKPNLSSYDSDDIAETQEFLVRPEDELVKKAMGITEPKDDTGLQIKTNDKISIDGVEVEVKKDGMNLVVDNKLLIIKVKDGNTTVSVDGEENNLNFMLKHNENNDEQQVVINKKSK